MTVHAYWLGWFSVWAVSHLTLGWVVYFAVRSAIKASKRTEFPRV